MSIRFAYWKKYYIFTKISVGFQINVRSQKILISSYQFRWHGFNDFCLVLNTISGCSHCIGLVAQNLCFFLQFCCLQDIFSISCSMVRPTTMFWTQFCWYPIFCEFPRTNQFAIVLPNFQICDSLFQFAQKKF